VEVTALLPRGADPHTWEPAPKDVKKAEEAEIAFVNGLGLEPAALAIIEANVGDGVPVIPLAEGPDVMVHEGGNPHLWMDPYNAAEYARVVRNELAAIDPSGGDSYAANLDAYVAEIEEADSYLTEATGRVPEEHRKLITTHDAFGYLADHIGFEITAFVTVGPGQDTSPDDIRAIVEAIEEQGVSAVFTEPQISSESAALEQVARDTGAMICTLYSDSLDDEVSTYIEMMRFNADELARCLGETAGG
jgi:zinc/manganese transport system substrate-binding protein/manganese/iron transport system substrate-binding protein